ncbi:hypothetical protein I5M32_11430 [Pedobacter sp. SD-b]|uniref:Fibronectin type-III domain-containing protein n=1 Tax=Pedobacter segetis TaxID=2793069 RepID=A0ABS1BL01_9SPHI|nr:glycoside hydrolase family 2 TIM barrel-domain containing protein [Pedobacter segetis]MBK0383569.1 hypothetical protein [Pedobacter segetis]
MRKFLNIFLLIVVLKCNVYAAIADTISLNGMWKFRTDLYKTGDEQQWYKTSFDKAGWDSMEVPGNWDLHNEYADYKGDAWYSVKFDVKDVWRNKNVRLIFQSVYNDAEVWLNGNKIGENHFGFLQFQFDLSNYLIYGQKNEIVVKVNNVFKRGAIWNWGGIRRPVWLEITDQTRINNLSITSKPDLKKQSSIVNLNAEVVNYSSNKIDLSYAVELFYKSKRIYYSGQQRAITLKGADSVLLTHNIHLNKADTHLWSFDFPNLYTAKIAVYNNKKLLHLQEDKFGIRKIEVEGLKLKLNGKEIRPVGFNLVPEDRITGNTLPFEHIKKMVDMMKEAGANMARISHLSLPKEFLDYLDEKGIMTFEEVSLWGKDVMVDPDNPIPKIWLQKLIHQEYNHPSIIGWSVGNEIGLLDKNPLANQYIKSAIENAKKLDPNRLAVYISNSAQVQPDDAAIYSDIIMLNSYGNWAKAAEKAHHNFPDKPIFFSEFGESLNTEDPNDSHLDFGKMLDSLKGKDYIIGASLWTFNDYRSSYWSPKKSWETPPSQNRAWGVVNSFLQKKRSYFEVQKVFLPLSITNLTATQHNDYIFGQIDLKINKKLDFPAYQLSGYKIAVQTLDNQKIIDSAVIKLPILNPGDGSKTFEFNIKNHPSLLTAIKFSLSDAQNFSRFDTLIYLKEPQSVHIKAVNTSENTVRVVFDPSSLASYYTLKYGNGKLENESSATINNFIEIKGLKSKINYQFQVVAHNNKGSNASVSSNFILNEDELPPIIWDAVAVKNGFFISFSSDPLDYRYEVEYGTQKGNYFKCLTFDNHGVLQIPNLDSDKTYFFRLRRLMQWGFASTWTNEIEIKPL